jgi:hypothetical protein
VTNAFTYRFDAAFLAGAAVSFSGVVVVSLMVGRGQARDLSAGPTSRTPHPHGRQSGPDGDLRAVEKGGGASISGRTPRSFAWAGYAASAWAIAYAVGVRGYHGLGGTVGLPGTFEDPARLRAASLVAGAGLFLAGLGSLALVRPWGLRLPRWLVLTPALAGAVVALSHALTAYVTKTLHLLGVIEIEFRGWVRPDEMSLILWDILFYEPWFLGLGALVMLAVLHHYGRTGGSHRGQRWLAVLCGATSVVWTAVACVQFI